ncbi:MAG: hypothetical protein ACI9W6_001038, partial [Motiliproteus sp.]
ASAVNLAIAYKDVGMPLLSGTDNGQWLDPAGLFQAEFHRFRRRFGVILMVRLPLQALQETA